MMTITNNGKRIGDMNPYDSNNKRLLLFSTDPIRVITTVGYCLATSRSLKEQLDDYLDYIASITKKYEGSLEQKIEFLNSHKEFELSEETYIANLVDSCVLKNDIQELLKEYDSLEELDGEEKESMISYLEDESDYLLYRLESIAGVKYQRFERVL